MKQQGNFLLMDRSEFREWLASQKITRTIDKLQVHHTYSPNYTTRKNQDHFKCLEGMRNFHMNTNGWSATGQNISTFEDGKLAISLDRNLNITPAGIAGANTGALCIENIGDFDFGGDIITDEQKKTIIHLYACLSEKLNLPIDTQHIVYHHWYSADGTKIVDFKTGLSISNKPASKTCPGSNFLGFGNTVSAAQRSLIPLVQEEYKIITSPKGLEIVNVKINGFKTYDGFLFENTTYVPIRVIGNALNVNIGWDEKLKKATVNGEVIDSTKIVKDTSYIPVRVISEKFGAKVDWDNKSRTVNIIK